MPAQGDQIQKFTESLPVYGIGLLVALVILAVLVHKIRSWYRDGDDPADERNEIVQQFQESRRRGDLSEEEFRSIKSQISRQNDR